MAKDFDYYFSQLRRIEEHRDQQAEKEIRKLYKEILKDVKTFIADEYEQYAEDGTLTFEMLRAKSRDARFLEEVERRLGGVAPEIAKEIKSAAKEMYQIAYDGMVEAVQKAKDTQELKERLKGLHGVSAETVRATVDNPILEIALEKNHKEIIWDIKREIATALTVGDRYDTMARRLTERVNVNYRKAVLISRTENHRVIERGHLDSAKSIDETLQKGSSGMRMTKKWMTMKDGVVRPQKRYKTKKGWKTGKARAGAPDHVKMHGVVVLEDELFDLGGGVMTEAPGQSGVAGHDCNCRCQVLHKLMDDEQFFKATGRHFPDSTAKDSEKIDKENVAKSQNGDIIKLGNEDVRKWYLDNVEKIRGSIDTSLPIEDQARQAFEARNKLRTKARNMMADKGTKEMLDKERPNKTFEELVKSKMKRKGMTRDEAIKDILETATKTNENVNRELGLGGE